MLGEFVIAGVSCIPCIIDFPYLKPDEGMSSSSTVYITESYPGFKSICNDSASGIFYSEFFQQSFSSEKMLSKEQVQLQVNYNILEDSFKNNSINASVDALKVFYRLAQRLAILDMSVGSAFYNSDDDSIDVRLYLKDGIHLGIAIFVDEDNAVMCTLHKDRELLFADTMAICDFESRIEMIAKVLNDEEIVS